MTVTQHRTTWAANSTSRSAQRRPAWDWFTPLFMASLGSALNICRSGITPNMTPASTEIRNAITIKDDCGIMWKLIGYSVGGCQFARPVMASHARQQAKAPPAIEIRKASESTCRRMRQRLDPIAIRMEISRARSAVCAANRLPRLAQAARSTIPASAITPARKPRAGPPRNSPIRPGVVSFSESFSSSFGYCLTMWAAIVSNSACTWGMLMPSLIRTTDQTFWTVRDSSQLIPPSDASLAIGTKMSGCRIFSVP